MPRASARSGGAWERVGLVVCWSPQAAKAGRGGCVAGHPSLSCCPACMPLCSRTRINQVVGHDLTGRPLIYSCLALATNRDVEDNRR